MNESCKMPLFSVIVPTFNRVALLRSTLESVFAQQVEEFELTVVDDGSTDGTVNYLQSLGKKVRFLQQANRGAGPARNFGARCAQGRYLAFLDSDDLWFPWTLQVYREVIERYDFPAFIAGKPRIFSGELDLNTVPFAAPRARGFADYFSSGGPTFPTSPAGVAWIDDEFRWLSGSSLVLRRDAFNDVGGFTEEWVNDEDTDLALRMGVAPGFVQITAPATFAYREHAAGVSKDHKRLLAGTWARVRTEREGRYPGGNARAAERRRIITRHIRPVTLSCIRLGLIREGWGLYWAAFAWHASLSRVKYLIAFPLYAFMMKFSHWSSGIPRPED
jgi:glycosyltransferase involved in cell wall biosynthesis